MNKTKSLTCIIVVHAFDGNVVSIEQAKKILNDPKLSDEQVLEIRDGFRMLSEVIFDVWFEERKTKKLPSASVNTTI